MAKVLIGNFMGPQGPVGPKGEQGIQGTQGPQGIPGKIQSVWGATSDETGDAKPEIGGTNLIPHSNIIYGGYYDNHGVFQKYDESLCCPEYIPVQYGEDLVYQVWQTDLSNKPWLSFTAYDSNKTFIPDSYISLYGTQGNVHHMIIPTTWIPENAAYIRCSFGFGEGSRAKLEHGVVPTDWSPAPEDKQDKIDLIGGTNLLTGTKDFSQSGGNPEWEYVNVWEDNGTYNGLTVKRKNTKWSGIRQSFNAKAGEKYVFSCYINVDNPVNIAFCNVVNNGEANKVDKYGINIADQCKAGKWTRISVSFNVFEDCVLQTRVESNDEENGYIQICGYKLERGTVPTDWSPAPEDPPATQNIGTFEDGASAKTAIYNWLFSGEATKSASALIYCRYSEQTLGELHDGMYYLIGYKSNNYGGIYAISYWRDRPLSVALINNGEWVRTFTKLNAEDVGAVSSAELTGLVEGILRNHGLIS